MRKFRVYISCPMSVYQARIDNYAGVIRVLGADVSFWDRVTKYTKKDLERADAVVVILENNNWKRNFSLIPSGTRSEIHYARDHNIPVYLGYYNSEGVHAIYETLGNEDNDQTFSGIPGTSSNFQKFIKAWKDEDEQKCPSKYRFGKDTDRYGDCDDCDLWDACRAEQLTFKSPKPPKSSLEDDIELTIAVEHEEWVKSCDARRQNIIESLYRNACISAGLDFMPAPRPVDLPGAISWIDYLKVYPARKSAIIYGTPGKAVPIAAYDKRLLILLM